ncbi:MAG: long-chain fatty acid--CoA ligase [Candidatus Freyarchaeota archaeon]
MAYRYPLLYKHILENCSKIYPDSEIVYRDTLRFTYKEMDRRARKCSNMLAELGVKEGDKVVCFDWNTYQFFDLYWGVPCMGAVLHEGNPRLSIAEAEYVVNHAEDKVLLFNQDFLPLIEAIAPKLKTVEHYIVINDTKEIPETKLEPIYNYNELHQSASADYEYPDLDENTIATMCYTTGTTGLPKGCVFSQRQGVLHSLVQSAASGAYWGITMEDVLLHITPLFHAHAWGLPYSCALFGMKQVLPGRYDPTMMVNLVVKEKCTVSAFVPTLLVLMMWAPNFKEAIPQLKGFKCFIGGAALPRGLAEQGWEYGMKIFAAYGLTESFPLLTEAFIRPQQKDLPKDEKITRWISTGLPVPLVQLRVVDENMNDVPADDKTMGEIVVRAPWLTMEYYKDPEKTAELWRGGWMHTGDIATIDKEGYIHIRDRTKDVIKSGGEWISTLTLEDVASLHPAVMEACVIGVKHAKWDERPLVIIVPKPEYKGKVTEKEILEHFKKYPERVPKWWLPDKVIFVDSLPKTSVGKFNKKVLRDQYKDILMG